MKYIGFLNSDDDILEVYLNKEGDLYLSINYGNVEEHPIKIEKEDIGALIDSLKELKDYMEKLKSDD